MKLFFIGENGQVNMLEGAKVKPAPIFEKKRKIKNVPSSKLREEIQVMLLKIGAGLPKANSVESDNILAEKCA